MTYAPGLGTHFNAPVDRETLAQIRGFHFRWARMDCQTCPIETMLAMIADVDAVGLYPLPIVYDRARLDALGIVPAVTDVEWSNEPDGDVLPATYRTALDAACERATFYHLKLWAPAISNLDRDSLRWLEAVRGNGWPPGLHGISVHRYGDGTFAWPHDGFASRDAEVEALLALCDGLPFIVTEFGYPTDTVTRERRGKREKYLQVGLRLTEAQAATNIAQEWEFWRPYTERPMLYQINDGTEAYEQYGIRRYPWDLNQWKPAAHTVPEEAPPMDDTGKATYCISRSLSFEAPHKPGAFCTYYPKHGPDGQRQTTTILSVQPDGSKDMRPKDAAGAWETWTPSKDGNRAIFEEAGEFFAIPLVD